MFANFSEGVSKSPQGRLVVHGLAIFILGYCADSLAALQHETIPGQQSMLDRGVRASSRTTVSVNDTLPVCVAMMNQDVSAHTSSYLTGVRCSPGISASEGYRLCFSPHTQYTFLTHSENGIVESSLYRVFAAEESDYFTAVNTKGINDAYCVSGDASINIKPFVDDAQPGTYTFTTTVYSKAP